MLKGPLFNAFTKAASFTVRGATVTFGSTVLSCIAACKIEQGANRMIYKYFPHKFANVEWANGLTEEQLDAVRVYRHDATTSCSTEDQYQVSTSTLFGARSLGDTLKLHVLHGQQLEQRYSIQESHSDNDSNNMKEGDTSNSKTKFWKEGEGTLASLIPVALPRQEILSCAMTG
jgi:hypothetical protein